MCLDVYKRQVSYTVVEAALFLEENYDAFCNETWYIYTSEDNRRLRLKESRGYSDEKIDRMFAAPVSYTHLDVYKRQRQERFLCGEAFLTGLAVWEYWYLCWHFFPWQNLSLIHISGIP